MKPGCVCSRTKFNTSIVCSEANGSSFLTLPGFDVIEEEVRRVDISKLRLANRYRHMELSDLECTVLKVALQKST
jgi:hypothetical protein